VLRDRVLAPLGLKDTYLGFPPGAPRAEGTNEDLQPMVPWTFTDALAGAGALVSNTRDQLQLIDAELDALAGSKKALGGPLRLTQEAMLDEVGTNAGLGWVIDREGRYWHNGTGGFHSFVGFDPKTRRGIVILAATSTSLVDHLANSLYKILENEPPTPVTFPTADQLVPLAGTYDFSGVALSISAIGRRLYIEGPGEPKHRLLPLSATEFFLEPLQAVVVFQKDGDQVARMVFAIGDHTMTAARLR
jgi:CubicO group peptidase (beta-lactamase class C family)